MCLRSSDAYAADAGGLYLWPLYANHLTDDVEAAGKALADFTGICLGDGSLVFRDGFESGDVSAWSTTQP